MKVKVKFTAKEEEAVIKDGKEVKEVKVYKDAIQLYDFNKKPMAAKDFGKNMANNLIVEKVPVECQDDPVGWGHFIDALYYSAGKEFEAEDKYLRILKDYSVKHFSSLIVYALWELIDTAIANAVADEAVASAAKAKEGLKQYNKK